MSKTLVLASHNSNKLREFKELLNPLGYGVISAGELGIFAEPEETGNSYAENALIKAKALRSLVDYPVLADDSGIEIAALGEHFPGIYSARYCAKEAQGDYHKMDALLIQKLQGVSNRAAAYHCCICLLEEKDGEPRYFEGICPGHILEQVKGNHGFGYDPIFHYDEGNLDFGVCSEEEKNAVSHRARAFQKLIAYLTSAK